MWEALEACLRIFGEDAVDVGLGDEQLDTEFEVGDLQELHARRHDEQQTRAKGKNKEREGSDRDEELRVGRLLGELVGGEGEQRLHRLLVRLEALVAKDVAPTDTGVSERRAGSRMRATAHRSNSAVSRTCASQLATAAAISATAQPAFLSASSAHKQTPSVNAQRGREEGARRVRRPMLHLSAIFLCSAVCARAFLSVASEHDVNVSDDESGRVSAHGGKRGEGKRERGKERRDALVGERSATSSAFRTGESVSSYKREKDENGNEKEGIGKGEGDMET